MADQNIVPLVRAERSILVLRRHRAILDSDLAGALAIRCAGMGDAGRCDGLVIPLRLVA
jgi:hypothetical protein